MATPQPNALTGFSQSLASAVTTASASVVTVNGRQRLSSTGIHWRQGVIVTSSSALERDDDITVTLADGTTVPTTLAGRDPSTDIAVLKADTLTIPAATLAESTALQVGHLVLALGRGDGLSASFGVISSVGGQFRTGRGGTIDQLIRAEITMYPGFSGGPLVDVDGKVLGFNTTHLSRSNAGITVPVATVNRVVDQLATKGKIARGYLGVMMQPVGISDQMKTTLNVQGDAGLIVIGVEQGGPAAQAGILIGDIIVSFEGQTISDTNEIQSLLTSDKVGQPVALQVIRAGALTAVTVTVGERQ